VLILWLQILHCLLLRIKRSNTRTLRSRGKLEKEASHSSILDYTMYPFLDMFELRFDSLTNDGILLPSQGEQVAVKQIKDAPLDSTDGVFSEFRREVWGMSGLRHENIVKLIGFCLNPCCIVSDFISNGNLYDYIYNESLPLDLPFLLRIATDIAKGLRFMQNLTPPIIHCDLKSPNILVSYAISFVIESIANT